MGEIKSTIIGVAATASVLGAAILGTVGAGTTPEELTAMPHPTTIGERYAYCMSYRAAFDVQHSTPCAVAVFTDDE